jgi:transposase
MFSLNSSQRYRLYNAPTDMRKSFDGLCGIINQELERSPESGEVFVFVNKRKDKIKLLHWEPGGLVLYYKRLEKGTLELPHGQEPSQMLTWTQLMLIIEGISRENTKQKKRMFST